MELPNNLPPDFKISSKITTLNDGNIIFCGRTGGKDIMIIYDPNNNIIIENIDICYGLYSYNLVELRCGDILVYDQLDLTIYNRKKMNDEPLITCSSMCCRYEFMTTIKNVIEIDNGILLLTSDNPRNNIVCKSYIEYWDPTQLDEAGEPKLPLLIHTIDNDRVTKMERLNNDLIVLYSDNNTHLYSINIGEMIRLKNL